MLELIAKGRYENYGTIVKMDFLKVCAIVSENIKVILKLYVIDIFITPSFEIGTCRVQLFHKKLINI